MTGEVFTAGTRWVRPDPHPRPEATFGRRQRAAGVTEEDRKALPGHKNGSITSHYSAAELGQLIEAANKVSATDSRGPVLTILKRKQA